MSGPWSGRSACCWIPPGALYHRNLGFLGLPEGPDRPPYGQPVRDHDLISSPILRALRPNPRHTAFRQPGQHNACARPQKGVGVGSKKCSPADRGTYPRPPVLTLPWRLIRCGPSSSYPSPFLDGFGRETHKVPEPPPYGRPVVVVLTEEVAASMAEGSSLPPAVVQVLRRA